MKFCLLFAVVSAVVISIESQVVYYPKYARIPSIFSAIPGLGFSNDDDPYFSGGNGMAYPDTQGRSKTFLEEAPDAQGRQGGDILGTTGGDLNVNSFPNPFLNFNKNLYRPRTKTVVIPPVCVACKCLTGFRSCADAGGRQWVSGECSSAPKLDQKAGAECSYTPPTSLSACDSSCVKTCLAKADNTAPAISDCTPIDAVNKKQCTSPCENLARGSIVKCNSAYPDVISNVPSPCVSQYFDRYKREATNSTPAIEASNAAPELQSSQESSSDRSSRLLKFGIPLVNPRVNVNPITNFVRGLVTATYVAADSVCLPGDLANAPLCN